MKLWSIREMKSDYLTWLWNSMVLHVGRCVVINWLIHGWHGGRWVHQVPPNATKCHQVTPSVQPFCRVLLLKYVNILRKALKQEKQEKLNCPWQGFCCVKLVRTFRTCTCDCQNYQIELAGLQEQAFINVRNARSTYSTIKQSFRTFSNNNQNSQNFYGIQSEMF